MKVVLRAALKSIAPTCIGEVGTLLKYYCYLLLFLLLLFFIFNIITIIIISISNSMICSGIWHKYHEWYFKIVIHNFTSR